MRKSEQKRGFTIIETLVAIAILVVGITVPMTIVYQATRTGEIAQDTVQAFYLAQEGVEFLRYVRDTNVIKDSFSVAADDPDWLDELGQCETTAGCYLDNVLAEVDDPGNVVANCGASLTTGCPFVRFNPTTGLYDSGGTEDTKFRRFITISETVAGREADVSVRVTWTTRGGVDKEVLVRERLFNWTGF